jgi:hypothetical protein
LHLPSLALCRA